MLTTFLATLTPMLTLFMCMMIGFTLKKTNIVSNDASSTLAKMLYWVFCPAISFSSMARFCTLDTLKTHSTNLLIFSFGLVLAVFIAILLSFLFVKEKCPERGIYQYALAFANSGYVGDPLVLSIFGEEAFSYYKLACIPISVAIYTWGMTILIPSGKAEKGALIKKIFNPSVVLLLLGMVVGLTCGLTAGNVPVDSTAYDSLFPKFFIDTVDGLKACMGPLAMLLAGITIAKYDVIEILKIKKVYIASLLRLTVIPAVLTGALFGIKELINLIFGTSIDNTPLILNFFAVAAPLGLNTIVFPEAYGGNPKTGASMTIISSSLCVITIPIMFALLCLLFGGNTWLPI